MTKAIWVLIFLIIGYVGYLLFQQWDKARMEHDGQAKDESAAMIQGDSLTGLPTALETSYRNAKSGGSSVFQKWFAANERVITDPRKAWIELELCVAMTRSSPAEAKRIYDNVKSRVPPSSPVWPRLKELEKTFE